MVVSQVFEVFLVLVEPHEILSQQHSFYAIQQLVFQEFLVQLVLQELQLLLVLVALELLDLLVVLVLVV